jgi:hypothetical protein
MYKDSMIDCWHLLRGKHLHFHNNNLEFLVHNSGQWLMKRVKEQMQNMSEVG